MKYLAITSLVLLAQLVPNESLRALVVFPMMAKSHNNLGEGVVRHLLEAGHEVVFMTCYPKNKNIPNLKEVDLSPIGDEFRKQDVNDAFKLSNFVGKTNINSLGFTYFVSSFHNELMTNEIVQNFLSDPNEKFDVVILEWFFSQITAGIPALYKCPLIWLGTTEAHGGVLKVIDEVPNPAYTADLFSSKTPPFGFWDRLSELWMATQTQLLYNCLIYYLERAAYNRIYPELAAKKGVTIPSYEEATFNGSLLFLNSHPSIGTGYKLPQNVKYIGGFHVDTHVKPLPQDIQKIMDGSKDGVIYFSMGSNLRSMDLSKEMIRDILDVFAQLKQQVIWKFEAKLENVPSNVHLVEWAPQQSILAHPNLKLFITHGGQLSTTEAIHFGVPVVGIPIFGDQYVNMQAVERKGFGAMIRLDEDLTKNLKTALNKVLSNPSYAKQAKYLSSVYHDRPVPPGQELVHWVEHVVKTQGAPHLRSPALMVSWYQKLYLDAILLLVILVSFLYYIVKQFKTKKVEKVKTK